MRKCKDYQNSNPYSVSHQCVIVFINVDTMAEPWYKHPIRAVEEFSIQHVKFVTSHLLSSTVDAEERLFGELIPLTKTAPSSIVK